jgi:hypothetical protein
MASADFSTNFVEISPGKALILKVYTGCIYRTSVVGCGLCNVVVTYPQCSASYTVSAWFILSEAEGSVQTLAVPLPSDFRSPGTPLRLTNGLRQLAHKEFASSG